MNKPVSTRFSIPVKRSVTTKDLVKVAQIVCDSYHTHVYYGKIKDSGEEDIRSFNGLNLKLSDNLELVARLQRGSIYFQVTYTGNNSKQYSERHMQIIEHSVREHFSKGN